MTLINPADVTNNFDEPLGPMADLNKSLKSMRHWLSGTKGWSIFQNFMVSTVRMYSGEITDKMIYRELQL